MCLPQKILVTFFDLLYISPVPNKPLSHIWTWWTNGMLANSEPDFSFMDNNLPICYLLHISSFICLLILLIIIPRTMLAFPKSSTSSSKLCLCLGSSSFLKLNFFNYKLPHHALKHRIHIFFYWLPPMEWNLILHVLIMWV